jgi:acetyl esterase/lipase
MIVIIPDYRLYPDILFPAFLEDSALAVRWTKDNAVRLGGDPNHIVLMGHSSGAYIAAMLALDRRWLRAVGLISERDIIGWVGLAGPYNFLLVATHLPRQVFQSVRDEATIQPINFVDAKAPPAFLVTGSDDKTVYPKNTLDLALRIRQAGGKVDMSIYPYLGHRALIGAFSPIFQILAPALEDVTKFVFRLTPPQTCSTRTMEVCVEQREVDVNDRH